MSLELSSVGPGGAERETPAEMTAEEAVAVYAETVYALALSQTRSRTDADDVFQEVFLSYVRKHPAFQSEEHRKAWFLRVTLNCCKKLWRSRSRHQTLPLDEAILLETPQERDLFVELARLPEKYRAVVHLFYFEGLSTREIAGAVGITPGAVRTRLSRARDMLEQRLGEF